MKIVIRSVGETQLKGFLLASMTFFGISHNAYLNLHAHFVSTLQHLVNLLLIMVLGAICLTRLNKVKKTTVGVAVIVAEIVLITAVKGGPPMKAIAQLSPIFTFCLSLEIANSDQKLFISFLDSLKYILLFAVLLDLATQVLYPHGLYKTDNYDINWLLGYKTERLPYSFSMVILFLYSAYLKRGRIGKKPYAIACLALLNAFLSRGTACVLAVALFILFCAVFEMKSAGSSKLIALCMNGKIVLGGYFFLLFSMILASESQFLMYILAKLGKSADFSGRATIWKKCLELFGRSPVFGNGHLSADDYRKLAGYSEAANPHNAMLSLLVEGGIVCAVLFILLYLFVLSGKRSYSVMEKRFAIFIYLTLMIGLTSSIYILSPYYYLGFWLMEHERRSAGRESLLGRILQNKRWTAK